MRWAEFQAGHRTLRAAAASAAEALRAGSRSPATALLGAWRFAAEPALAQPFLANLARLAPSLGPGLGVWGAELPGPGADLDRPARAWLREAEVGIEAPADPLAAALAALAWWGGELEALERRSWASRAAPPDPARDAAAAALWAAWFTGDLTRVWRSFEATCWPAARRALTAALMARGVPLEEHARIRDETRESFLLLFLGEKGAPPGWRELGVRVVEGAHPDGPTVSLAQVVEPALWRRFFQCARRRQPWRGTRARLDPSRSEEGPLGGRWVEQQSDRLEAQLDLHAAHSLARAWRDGATAAIEPSWRVLRHHRHRVRGRLRALVRDQPGRRLMEGVLALDGLHARTEAAVASYVWAWAHVELKGRYAVAPRVVTPICTVPEPRSERRPREDTAEILAIERCWYALVCLRGQRAQLGLWIAAGHHANGSLAELMQLLPPCIADPDTAAHQTWHALRRSLRQRAPEHDEALRPIFQQIAALDPARRDLKRRVLALLDAIWHPLVPLPRGGFPRMVAHARAQGGAA